MSSEPVAPRLFESRPAQPAATDLLRALMAIARNQGRFLADVERTCADHEDYLPAFLRWQEWLTLLAVQIQRAQGRLRQYLSLPPGLRPWQELPGPALDRHGAYRLWLGRLDPWLRRHGVDTRYRRVSEPLELDAEAVTADAITDLVCICELAESTGTALSRCHDLHITDHLEDIAFYHVLSPWRQHGQRALLDGVAWLAAIQAELGDL